MHSCTGSALGAFPLSASQLPAQLQPAIAAGWSASVAAAFGQQWAAASAAGSCSSLSVGLDLLGLATSKPTVVKMIDDLLTPDTGFAIAEREVEAKEIGGSPRHLGDLVLGVVRNGKLLRVGEPEVDALEKTDRILFVRDASLQD